MQSVLLPFILIFFFAKGLYAQSNCLDSEQEAKAIREYAKTLYVSSQKQKAFDTIERFNKRLQQCNQDTLTAHVYHLIGSFYYGVSRDYAKSLSYFQKAFAVRDRDLPLYHTDKARNLYMIGVNYKELAQYSYSKSHIEKAILIFQHNTDTAKLVDCLSSLGSVYGYLGDNENGKLYLKNAYQIYKNRKYTIGVANCERELGMLFIRQRLFDSAIIHLKESLNLYQSSNDSTELGNTSVNYCIALQGTDSLTKALNTAKQAINYYTQVKREDSDMAKRIGNAYIELGNCYQKLKQDTEAKTAYLNAINKFQTDTSLAINPYHAEAYRQLGALLSVQNQPQQALEQYQKAFKILVQSFKSDDVLETPSVKTDIYAPMEVLQLLSLKSHALYQLAKSPNAPPQYKKAFKQIMKQIDTLQKERRMSFWEDRSKFDLVEMLLPVYQDAISLSCWSEGDSNAFLHYLEQNKAVALREQLQDNVAQRFAHIDTIVLSKENNLKGLISAFRGQVLAGHSDYQDSLSQTKKELYDFVKTLEKENPEYYKLKYETVKNLTVDSIQKHLPPNMAFIEYYWGPDSIYCLAISKKTYSINALDIKDSLMSKFIYALAETDKKTTTEQKKIYLSNAHAFYNDLLKSALTKLNADSSITRLKIVPDGLLNYLPFDALLEKEEDHWESSKSYQISYLIQKYAISYDFSANIAFDSTYHVAAQNKQWYGVGLSYQHESQQFPNAIKKITPLVHALREIKNFNAIFPNALIATDSIPNSTTKQAVLLNIPNYDNFHFSGHGFLDEREPLNSALVLSRLDEKTNNNLLTASYLYGQSFGADKMVVLSACDTGNGQLHRGEGLMSLGRAFAYSGFSTMVVTNWSVNEMSTGIILQEFYKNLKQGLPKDIALQHAQITYLKLGITKPGNPSIPNRWAALKIVGKIGEAF